MSKLFNILENLIWILIATMAFFGCVVGWATIVWYLST